MRRVRRARTGASA